MPWRASRSSGPRSPNAWAPARKSPCWSRCWPRSAACSRRPGEPERVDRGFRVGAQFSCARGEFGRGGDEQGGSIGLSGLRGDDRALRTGRLDPAGEFEFVVRARHGARSQAEVPGELADRWQPRARRQRSGRDGPDDLVVHLPPRCEPGFRVDDDPQRHQAVRAVVGSLPGGDAIALKAIRDTANARNDVKSPTVQASPAAEPMPRPSATRALRQRSARSTRSVPADGRRTASSTITHDANSSTRASQRRGQDAANARFATAASSVTAPRTRAQAGTKSSTPRVSRTASRRGPRAERCASSSATSPPASRITKIVPMKLKSGSSLPNSRGTAGRRRYSHGYQNRRRRRYCTAAVTSSWDGSLMPHPARTRLPWRSPGQSTIRIARPTRPMMKANPAYAPIEFMPASLYQVHDTRLSTW